MSAEHLRRAAAIVRERGLAKGEFIDEQGAVCALGALRVAHFGSADYPPFHDQSRVEPYRQDKRTLRPPAGCVLSWNDRYDTTAEDVAAAFEAAADRLEASS